MATQSIERMQPGWRFWFVWMSATIAGVFVYVIVFPPVFSMIDELSGGTAGVLWIGIAIAMIGQAGLGAAIGVGQWLILRGHLPRTGWWILATLVGYSAPMALQWMAPGLEPPWLVGAAMYLTFGIVLGVLQWLVLRGRVDRASWWIAISIGGWMLAFALTGLAVVSGLYVEPFDLLAAFFVPVAVAGGGIMWLLRRSPSAVVRENLPN